MRIVVDGFGGDNAPLAVLQGAELAIKEYGVDITITGDENIIKKVAQENNISLDKMTIVHTTDVIEVCEDPTTILKEHSESSMAVAMKLVASGAADAFVSAGSTGAIVVGSSLIVKRIKGVKRPTIATIMPCKNGCFMLVDGGANLDCRPEMLVQFATMGSIYMNKIQKVENVRVGLVNVGAEETKGRDLQIETYHLLKNSDLNFIGNIEARDIPLNGADVVVTDGFTGNVILKMAEGMGKFFTDILKGMFTNSFLGKLGALCVIKDIKSLKKTMDYKEYGGAPLLGASKPVIKAHGSSDKIAFKNAIRQAIAYVDCDVTGEITKAISKEKESK